MGRTFNRMGNHFAGRADGNSAGYLTLCLESNFPNLMFFTNNFLIFIMFIKQF